MNSLALRRSALRAVSRTRVSSAVVPKRTFITIIEQGKEGWRLSLGRDPVRLSPGLNLNIPLYHSVQKIDLRESSISIPNLTGYTADNVPVTCSGSLFFRIVDGQVTRRMPALSLIPIMVRYKACFAISEVQDNIRNTGTSAMRSVIGHFSYDQVIGDRNELNKRLNTVIGNSITNWGVECTRFEIQSFQPANREVERQLELQMEAERNRRKQLLDTQAQINVAEGQKQRVILESEGHLAAKSNEADAAFKTVVREAEARKQQALMEASALASQIDALAEAVAAPGTAPGPAERKQALDALIELRRLEQLRAIAKGKGNATYFFGDRAALGLNGGAGDAFNVDYAEHVKGNMAKGKSRVDAGGPAAL
ncbi:PHB domain-containing protein [Mycena sanguinolenta]|uniref:PHB domain-containing protein n=1 Tax=Mycena sanguinolenta TaxID=230812 RepID=A0A8H7DJL7_9AGAR|nr:PHB domain-containing protein [Mycena sanguinolenta]